MALTSVLLLCGGKSAEHEISIRSAKNVLAALDPKLYNTTIVGICRSGLWQVIEDLAGYESIPCKSSANVTLIKRSDAVYLIDGANFCKPIDVVLPIVHGSNCEDGSLQGLLEVLGVPYIGSDVYGSAFAMDKQITKLLASENNIPVVPAIYLHHGDTLPNYATLKQQLNSDCFFVKACNLGSSVGVYKVTTEQQLSAAIANAFTFSSKIMIERGLNKPRELECAVLGNNVLIVSKLGEIQPLGDFYSYDAKYLDPNGAILTLPAVTDQSTEQQIQNYSRSIFKALGLKGMARIDFFQDSDGQIYLNEVNTIPGFTNISMYPKLMENIGISYHDLINQLISLAFKHHSYKNSLKLKP